MHLNQELSGRVGGLVDLTFESRDHVHAVVAEVVSHSQVVPLE